MRNNTAYPPAPHKSPNGPHTCSLHLDSLPTSCSRVQPEQAGHSVHRWFGLSHSKCSRHLNKTQHSVLSSLSLPSVCQWETVRGGLIKVALGCHLKWGYISQDTLPKVPQSAILYDILLYSKVLPNQTSWLSWHHCRPQTNWSLSDLPRALPSHLSWNVRKTSLKQQRTSLYIHVTTCPAFFNTCFQIY